MKLRIDGIFAPLWEVIEGINGVTVFWSRNGTTYMHYIEYPKTQNFSQEFSQGLSQLKDKNRL